MTNGWPDSKAFWGTRRVIVTGGNGFLGKHVLSGVEGNIVRKLNERGADVCVIDIDPSAESTQPLSSSSSASIIVASRHRVKQF